MPRPGAALPDIKMNQTVKSAFYSHKRFFYTRGVGGQRKSPPHPTAIPDATGFAMCALWQGFFQDPSVN